MDKPDINFTQRGKSFWRSTAQRLSIAKSSKQAHRDVTLPIIENDLYKVFAIAVMLLAIQFEYRKGRDGLYLVPKTPSLM